MPTFHAARALLPGGWAERVLICLLYTSDAADEL